AVFATTFLLASSLGLLEVGYPGFAAQAHRPPLAGLLIATNSIGSAIGGLIYGGLNVALAHERQLRRVLGMLVLPLVAQAVITSAGWLALVAFLAGLCIAPSLTIVTLLISSYAPARYATEAFTWSATFIVSGIGVGNVLGGVLLERFNPAAAFACSAAAAALAAGCAFALRASSASNAISG
ncbi:MAG: hypothetical protein ABI316_05810, partial [Casimicrobiaceae bacterium]